MGEDTKRYYRISKQEIFANPKNGAYITGERLMKLHALLFISIFISFITIALKSLKK